MTTGDKIFVKLPLIMSVKHKGYRNTLQFNIVESNITTFIDIIIIYTGHKLNHLRKSDFLKSKSKDSHLNWCK